MTEIIYINIVCKTFVRNQSSANSRGTLWKWSNRLNRSFTKQLETIISNKKLYSWKGYPKVKCKFEDLA